jgi:hypothetical protein
MPSHVTKLQRRACAQQQLDALNFAHTRTQVQRSVADLVLSFNGIIRTTAAFN